MKDGVRIADASRGGVIDQAALLRALESGKVAGAGLDVYEKEPPVDWVLAEHPRVIATPHRRTNHRSSTELRMTSPLRSLTSSKANPCAG